MQVRIRFRRGPVVTRRKGKNSRVAQLAASALTLLSVSCLVLALWRIGIDLDLAGGFVFTTGLLSHWQVWMAVAAISQFAGWKLTVHARQASYLEIAAESSFAASNAKSQDDRRATTKPSVRASAANV